MSDRDAGAGPQPPDQTEARAAASGVDGSAPPRVLRSHRSVSAPESFDFTISPIMAAQIREWKGDPQLGRLHDSLSAHSSEKSYLDRYAEALIARHLLSKGCALRFEVMTPLGKQCDFEVITDNFAFYLHTKRLSTESDSESAPWMTSHLRYLERIKAPYIVQLRWGPGLTEETMQRLVEEAAPFIRRARVGDEIVVRNGGEKPVGGVRIVAPAEGEHVRISAVQAESFVDHSQRFARLLRRAAMQFMPGEPNMVLVCSDRDDDLVDFETALLGSHIERWDTFPPHGRRVAHGRAADGIWEHGSYAGCQAAGWFRFSPNAESIEVKLWLRGDDELPTPLMREMIRIFSMNALGDG